MKKMIFFNLLLSMISFYSISQSLKYTNLNGSVKPKGSFNSYISKNGDTYSIGDTLQIGTPSGTNGKFVFIQHVDFMGGVTVLGPGAVNTSVIIKKIRVGGGKRTGWKGTFQTTGYGTTTFAFFIEDAIDSGEVKSKGMTSDEALEELKKAKSKLDLELITQQQYDSIKAILAKYIK